MAVSGNGQISFSFIGLRELLKSFDELQDGSPRSAARENAIYQLVDHLGDVAAPVLLRKLFGSPGAGRWASLLLLRLGQTEEHRVRIVGDLREALLTPELPDMHKLRAADLLATLDDASLDEACDTMTSCLSCPAETAEFSLVELASCIGSADELARAADILIGDLPPEELLEFVEDMAVHQPGSAAKLISELGLRDDLAMRTRSDLQQIGVSLECEDFEPPRSHPRRPGLRLAKNSDGSSALVVYARISSETPIRYRALSMEITPGKGLVAASYLESVTRGEVDRQIIGPLVEAGYELSPLAPGEARDRAVVAMRARTARGESMPRSYYLGRDLLGLHNEHLLPQCRPKRQDAALLARGTELLARGKAQAARELLVRYATSHPDDSEAMATLGNCLMRLGDTRSARAHLERAAWLSPRIGRYHWNRASLAHQEGRLGECFLALKEYLGCVDAVDTRQRSLARSFIAEYSRKATLRAPMQSPHETAMHEATETRGAAYLRKN